MKYEITEQDTFPESPPIKLDVHTSEANGFLNIEVEGLNTCSTCDDTELGEGHRAVVSFEIWQGEIRLLVWADINDEAPTNIINLNGAKVSARKCDYCGGECPADHDHACDGFLGDIDGLYAGHTKLEKQS
jgi:hypothetical protein